MSYNSYEIESWKSIKESARYEVSNFGNFRNTKTKKIRRPGLNRDGGYRQITFNDDNGVVVCRSIHRLAATVWVPNPHNLPQVNHNDGNRLNNAAYNLEWCSQSTNIIHAYDNRLNKSANPLTMYDNDTHAVREFRSVKELSDFFGISPSNINPLLRCSDKYPIMGRYTVVMNDEEAMFYTPNSEDKGKIVYVYDITTDELTSYPSVRAAAYYTGIRSLGESLVKNDPIYRYGYHVSHTEELLPLTPGVFDAAAIEAEKVAYLSRPYKKLPEGYFAYDYLTKKEVAFATMDDMAAYLSIVDGSGLLVTKAMILTALRNSTSRKKTVMVKGYGLRSSLHEADWFPYNLEDVLNSKNNRTGREAVYEVTIGCNKCLAFGINQLAKVMNYDTSKITRNTSIEDMVSACCIHGMIVRRLNIPV